jgi:dienelactone hydrolase
VTSGRRLSATALTLALLLLSSCAAPWHRLDNLAAHGGLYKRVVSGAGFDEVVYERHSDSAPTRPLVVFLEGDGRPWAGPREVSRDPTSRHPVALALALQTPGNVAYVARPCYHEFAQGSGCSPVDWTSDRYSAQTVASMTAAILTLDPGGTSPIWLVGYSGGGTLAVLIAPHLPRAELLVTLAANLDTQAWTRLHGYLPLSGSLNPTDAAPLPARIRQLHLFGGRDGNIPAGTSQRFVAAQPNASARQIEGFDHVCCWVEHWPEIWDEITRPAPGS